MSSGNGNPLGNRGRGPAPDSDPAMNPWLNSPDSEGNAPRLGRFSDPTSRRRFLRTAVAAGAVVAGTGVIGGIVAANRKPGIVSSTLAGRATPSGQCVEITQGVKGSEQNPNQHIQISTSDFTTYVGTISNGTFTIVHPYAVLVDKNNHNPDLTTCIQSAEYDNGNLGQVILTVDPGVTTTVEYPAKSCLYVSQTRSC
jgi:hypothetical protein